MRTSTSLLRRWKALLLHRRPFASTLVLSSFLREETNVDSGQNSGRLSPSIFSQFGSPSFPPFALNSADSFTKRGRAQYRFAEAPF